MKSVSVILRILRVADFVKTFSIFAENTQNMAKSGYVHF
jgi:hypothetical protein